MSIDQFDPNASDLEQELERQIIYGLKLEYDHALLNVSPPIAAKIKRPLFRLSATVHQLGAWHAAKREICLSRHLTKHHSWGIVREVLLHEMAHQLADEILGAGQEPAHGSKFQQACKMLNANPKASGAIADLDADRHNNMLPHQDRLFRKVQKLMALSHSENPYEASSAMAKAHELILKFNLPLLKEQQSDSFTTMFVGKPALRHYREDYLLANLLQEFYFVEGLWVISYVLGKLKMGRVYEISGSLTNVKIAAYVYDCIRQYIEAQWKDFSSTKKLGRYRKSDFSAGIVTGFYQKLEDERYHNHLSPEERALILKKDPHLKKYMAERYPHTRSIRGSRCAVDEKIYTKGIEKGKKLSLHKGVEASSSHRDHLLIE